MFSPIEFDKNVIISKTPPKYLGQEKKCILSVTKVLMYSPEWYGFN